MHFNAVPIVAESNLESHDIILERNNLLPEGLSQPSPVKVRFSLMAVENELVTTIRLMPAFPAWRRAFNVPSIEAYNQHNIQ